MRLCKATLSLHLRSPPLLLAWLPHVQIETKVEKSQSVILAFSPLKLKQL